MTPIDQTGGKDIHRPGVRKGYDIWSDTYDVTPNPLVLLDRRYTLPILNPKPSESILDIGCGTGYHLAEISRSGAKPLGMDFSEGMLRKARMRAPNVPLVVADIHRPLPFKSRSFDAVLCALVSEHLSDLSAFCKEARRTLRPGGRFVFSAFHPAMAEAGTEANFQVEDVEYRLGAEKHTLTDYRKAVEEAGINIRAFEEYEGDGDLAEKIPKARKYVGRKMLLIIEGAAS